MPPDVLVLDANVMVLLVVGLADRSYIARHKRLDGYTVADFDLLTSLMDSSPRTVITPHAVTEACNLAGHIAEPARGRILGVLGDLVRASTETYVSSAGASLHPAYTRLGITDAVLLSDGLEGTVLLTTDLELYLTASRSGRAVVNFNHYIQANRP